MEMRMFGRTGMRFSLLGFGCGAVGGLIVRGDPADQERTIARAIAASVNYFDTAVQYGNGESEKNLGRVLQRLKPANVVVGTKVRVPSGRADRASARTERPASSAAFTVSRPIPLLAPMIRTVATASCSLSDPPGSPSCAMQAATPQEGRALAVARRVRGRKTGAMQLDDQLRARTPA
jgi:Aldo/keto reductase family